MTQWHKLSESQPPPELLKDGAILLVSEGTQICEAEYNSQNEIVDYYFGGKTIWATHYTIINPPKP